MRGHRVETEQAEQTARLVSDGIQIEPLLVAPVAALPMLLALLLVLLLSGGRRSRRDDGDDTDPDACRPCSSQPSVILSDISDISFLHPRCTCTRPRRPLPPGGVLCV